jgi:FKBP-type peptidyl-prolyl cis-trans isomerase
MFLGYLNSLSKVNFLYKSLLSFVFCFVLILNSCVHKDKENFYKLSNSIYAKRITVGDKTTTFKNKVVIVSFRMCNKYNIDVPLLNYKSSFTYIDTFYLDKISNDSPLKVILDFSSPLDSSVFKIELQELVKEKRFVPAIKLADSEKLLLYFKIVKVISEEELKKTETLQKSYTSYLKSDEKSELTNFIKNNPGLNFIEIDSLLFKAIVKKGNGKRIKSGNTLVLQYTGKFLNNEVFDHIGDDNSHFEYKIGTPDQLLKGLEKGVLTMEEEEKCVFLFNSFWGYGEKGNSNGIVEPFKSLTFDVFLKKIK